MAIRPGLTTAGSSTEQSKQTVTIGTTATRVLFANKKRTEYRIHAHPVNNYRIGVGKDSSVALNNYFELVPPGHRFVDSGDQLTIYRGEVWIVSEGAGQLCDVEETIQK